MLIGIKDLSAYIPRNRQDLNQIMKLNNCPPKELKILQRMLKLKQVPIVDDGQKLEDTLSFSIAKIIKPNATEKIKLVLYSHTVIGQVPYNYDLMYKVLKKFNLHKTQFYGISHFNCASFFKALELSMDFLRNSPEDTEVLIISGDQTNFLSETRHIPNSSIMGDSSTAMLLSNNANSHKILSVATLSDTRFYNGLYAEREETKLFNTVYFDNLNKVIHKVLLKKNLNLQDIDWIVPHNVNFATWDKYSKNSGFEIGKILTDLIEDISHTYNTDSQINLEYGMKVGKIKKGQLCLLVGVGLGSFFGACIIEI